MMTAKMLHTILLNPTPTPSPLHVLAQPRIAQIRLDQWMHQYKLALADTAEKYPAEYPWYPIAADADTRLGAVSVVANRMRSAFVAGSFHKDGRAIKLVCKANKIPHTYKAIAAFLAGA